MFEWDDDKRLANIEKHGLDFLDAIDLFDGRRVVHVLAKTVAEERVLTIGMLRDKAYTLVWTQRGAARRLISFRRARRAEERAYDTDHS